MTRWVKRFKEHEVHELVVNAMALAKADVKFEEPAAKLEFSRAAKVLEHVENSLQRTDPDFATPAQLDELVGPLQNTITQLEQFASNADALGDSVHENLDELLGVLGHLPTMAIAQPNENVADEIERISDVALQHASEQRSEAQELINELTDSKEKLIEELAELRSEVDAERQRMDVALAEANAAFNESMQRYDQTMDASHAEFEGKRDQTFTEFTNEGNDLVRALQVDKDKAAEIVGLIANTGITGLYKRAANNDWIFAIVLRILGLLFMIAMVYTNLQIVESVTSGVFGWEVATFKILSAAALLIPAFYCTKAASEHLAREQIHRKRELELASIDPYLNDLPEESRTELKTELSRRFFGQPDDPSEPDSQVLLETILDKVAELVRDRLK